MRESHAECVRLGNSGGGGFLWVWAFDEYVQGIKIQYHLICLREPMRIDVKGLFLGGAPGNLGHVWPQCQAQLQHVCHLSL